MTNKNIKRKMERWVVLYINGDGSDDWQLVRNDYRAYFDSKDEALKFSEKYKFKNKPSYWNPSIWKEELKSVVTESWQKVKEVES